MLDLRNVVGLLSFGLLVTGAPTERSLHKRHSNCWQTTPEGCEYPLTGNNGAVVSEVGTCSEIGIDILKQGGNAADGIIATALCVGTISAYHSGIGGGGFMVLRFNHPNGSHDYETIDFREAMPAAGNQTTFSQYGVNQTKSTIGGLAAGVPGEMRGWEQLHSRHGALPWKDLFAPAINLARNGFLINPDLAAAFVGKSYIANDTLFAETYAPNGTLLTVGETAYRKRYANTLERIANEGPGIFYANSSIADNIISSLSARGGIMTHDDLIAYKALVKPPAMATYRNKRIFTTVAPSSGNVALSALKIFEGFDGSAQDNDPAINLTTHRLVQATKFAYGQRANYGDPAFTPNVTTLEELYLRPETYEPARARILDNSTFTAQYYDPSQYVPSREAGTSYIAVIDSTGMAVSLTTTVNLYWGSTVMTPDGIILNDEMDDFGSPGQVNAFGFASSPINYVQGGKRPQSSICNSLVENADTGELVMATGSAGGSRIITATIQQIHHYVDQGLNATASTAHPRWHDQLGISTFFELPAFGSVGYDNGTVAFFKSVGYNTTYEAPGGSTSSAISRLPDGSWLAGAESRRPAAYGAAY